MNNHVLDHRFISRISWLVLLVSMTILDAKAQDMPARQSFGIISTYAPDSSHIFIGTAEKRRVWTIGVLYGRTLWSNKKIRLDYQGTISPFFQERDPTLIGGYADLPGGEVVQEPVNGGRVVYVNNDPIGVDLGGGSSTPIYPIYGSEKTYAVAFSPLGAKISGFNSKNFQPTFSLDLGIVASSKDIPVDNSANFNYLFSFGPGFEYFYDRNKSISLEYVYRHMSNANSGNINPGVDAGVFRIALNFRRR